MEYPFLSPGLEVHNHSDYNHHGARLGWAVAGQGREETPSMKRRTLEPIHLFLALLLALSGCMQLAYESMNDSSRDAWQQPKAVIEALSITPGARVADLGAGGGYFTFPLAEAVGPEGRVYAVDVEEAGLRFIDKRAKELGLRNIALILAAPDDPRLPAEGVDLIFTSNTYHHLTNRVAYFKSLVRRLHPAGRVAIIEYKDDGWFGHATAKETVRREMEAAGYRLINDFDFLPKQHFQIFKPVAP